MRYCLLFVILFIWSVVSLSQVSTLDDHNCDYVQYLAELQLLDNEGQLQNATQLHLLAMTAKRAEQDSLSKLYFSRITSTPKQNLIEYFHSVLHQKHYGMVSVDLDSIATEISAALGSAHDLAHLARFIDLTEKLNKSPQEFADSSFQYELKNIADVEKYSFTIAWGLLSWAKYLANNGDIDRAIKASRRALDLARKYHPACAKIVGLAEFSLGRRYLDADQLDSAKAVLLASFYRYSQIKPTNPISNMQVALAIAEVCEKEFQMEQTLSWLDTADRYGQQNEQVYLQIHPTIINRRGNVFAALGKNDKAKEFYLASLKLAEKSPNKIQRVAAYTNLCNQLIKIDEFSIALTYLENSIDICRSVVGENHIYSAIIYMKLGDVHYHLKNYVETENYYYKSLAIRKQLYGDSHPSVSNVYTNFATFYRDIGSFDKALVNINAALRGYLKVHGGSSVSVAGALNRRASIHARQEDHQRALRDANAALQALACKDFRDCADVQLYLDLLEKKVTSKFALLGNDRVELDSILSICHHGQQVFSHVFQLAETLEDAASISANYTVFYKVYIQSLVVKFNSTGEKEYLVRAYQLTNQVKNISLLQSLRNRELLFYADIPSFQLVNLRRVKRQIKQAEKRMLNSTFSGVRDSLLTVIVELNNNLHNLNAQLKAQHPAFSGIQNLPPLVELESIQADLQPTEILLDFVMVNDGFIVFKITGDSISVDYTTADWGVDRQEIKNYLTSISSHGSMLDTLPRPLAWISSWGRGVVKTYEFITVIPDGIFSALPFELILRATEQQKLANITYANSANILSLQKNRKLASHEYSVAILAPNYDFNMTSSAPLRYSQQESENIANIYAKESVVFKKDLKINFITNLFSADILHLSMHTKLLNSNPLDSRFLFTHDSIDADNLFLYELYQLESDAQLAVLSACETGVGEAHNGAGTRSLANGFQYAGVPAVVMSLWKVPDQSTSQIMSFFYTYLKEGDRKDIALRKAKERYIELGLSKSLKHPFYWAGFVLVGDQRPIYHSSNSSPVWHYALAFFALLLVLFFVLSPKVK